jgi:AcrR family transcriptional regulator
VRTEIDASAPPDAGRRAQPLTQEDRQAMIVEAVIPLLIEHGRQITSKQIAEAAGVAEGTVFRAFGDKDSVIDAAIMRYLDPEPLRQALRELDPALPLDVKIQAIVRLMRERFGGVFRVMAQLGHSTRPPGPDQRHIFVEIIAHLLEPDLERLSMPPARIASFIRLVAFASAFPQLNESMGFTDEELSAAVLYGVAGRPAAPGPDSPAGDEKGL